MFSFYVQNCQPILEPAEKRYLSKGAIIKQGFGKSQVLGRVSSKYIRPAVRLKDGVF